jgi:hypothetical protein
MKLPAYHIFSDNLYVEPDIRYPALPDIRPDIRLFGWPDIRPAGYPAKSVSGASLEKSKKLLTFCFIVDNLPVFNIRVGAGAASRYGFGPTQMMQLRLRNSDIYCLYKF